MAGKPKKHLVDGRMVTVPEIAEEFGLTCQQIYQQMHHKACSLQVIVDLYRENQILHGQGHAGRHYVDGQWMTVRQASEMLGVSMTALYNWMHNHRRADGRPARLADAVDAYREGLVKHDGREPVQHRVGGRTMTTFEAAEKLGINVLALRLHMSRHKASLASTIRYYEQRKRKKAEKDILAILMEGRS